jgi:hypothetical protein
MSNAATLIDVTPGGPGDGIARRVWQSAQGRSKPFTTRRKAVALAIAAAADALQLGLAPVFGEGFASPADDVLDVVVAMLLVGVMGLRTRLLLALAAELVPGMALFPTWTAVVLTLPTDAAEVKPIESKPVDAERMR